VLPFLQSKGMKRRWNPNSSFKRKVFSPTLSQNRGKDGAPSKTFPIVGDIRLSTSMGAPETSWHERNF